MIYVVIPVFNRLLYTDRCISSLLKQQSELKIFIVDDGSTDGTYDFIRTKYPEVFIIKGSGYLFWTGAVRKGIDYILANESTEKDYIALVNNDVVIKDANILNSLVSYCEATERRAICSPLTLSVNQPDISVTSGVIMDSWFLNKTSKIFDKRSLSSVSIDSPIEVDFLTGRLLLHPIEIFSGIGNYDCLNFPHYGGDDEFTIRAKRAGYQTVVLPYLHVYLTDDKLISQQGILFRLFNKRSSINLRDKFIFSIKVVPFLAFPSYLFIAVVKSIIASILRK